MTSHPVMILAALAGSLCMGCAQQRSSSAEAASRSALTSAAESMQGTRSATRPVSNTQEAYRQQLLQTQLRQSQLDLQQVSSQEERASVQKRIAIIERQLEILGAQKPQIDLAAMSRQSRQSQGDSRQSDMVARDAMYAAGQPVMQTQQQLFPRDVRDPEQAAAEQAVNMLVRSQTRGGSHAGTAAQRRLSQLQLDLQMAGDDTTKDAIAREIAELRLQIAETE